MKLNPKTLAFLMEGESILAPNMLRNNGPLKPLHIGREETFNFLIPYENQQDISHLLEILKKTELIQHSSIHSIQDFQKNYKHHPATEIVYFSIQGEFDSKFMFRKIKKEQKTIWLCPPIQDIINTNSEKQKLWKTILQPYQNNIKS